MSRPCLLLLCLVLSLPAAAQDQKQIDQNQEELARVRGRIEAVQGKLKRDRGRKDSLQEELQTAERRIAQAQKELAVLDSQIARQQNQMRSTQDERARTEDILKTQRAALGRQLRTAYLIGERGQIKLLLNQQDTQKLGRVLTYYDFLNRSRMLRIQGIATQLDILRNVDEKLRAQLDELTGLKTQQQETLGGLESRRKEREVAMRKLQERIADEFEELKDLRANEKNVQELLISLRDVLADIPVNLGDAKPFPQMRGKLPWPLRGPVLAKFGEGKVGGKLSWNGLWLSASSGSPVRAVARGRVAYIGWLQRYGLIVILEHDGGYFSLYGHTDRVTRTEGEWINPGEVIATAGSTGGYEQSGVYFEIRKGSDPINPGDWLGN